MGSPTACGFPYAISNRKKYNDKPSKLFGLIKIASWKLFQEILWRSKSFVSLHSLRTSSALQFSNQLTVSLEQSSNLFFTSFSSVSSIKDLFSIHFCPFEIAFPNFSFIPPSTQECSHSRIPKQIFFALWPTLPCHSVVVLDCPCIQAGRGLTPSHHHHTITHRAIYLSILSTSQPGQPTTRTGRTGETDRNRSTTH